MASAVAPVTGVIVRVEAAFSPLGTLPGNVILVLLAVVSLLAMPVTANAGMREPHPHALLQLVIDEADGELDHHLAASSHMTPRSHSHTHANTVDPFSLAPATRTGGIASRSLAGVRGGTPAVSIDAPIVAPSVAGLIWSFFQVLLMLWRPGDDARRGPGRTALDATLPDGFAAAPDGPPPRSLRVYFATF
ncbi:MAG: hypothetical protein ACR2J8_15485 [Thermomicrobiales bacterium]